MLMCDKCFKSVIDCRCEDKRFFDVDDSIFDIISVLNLKGYITTYCCGGHVKPDEIIKRCSPNIYIKFAPKSFVNLIQSNLPEFLSVEYSTCIIRYTLDINRFLIYKPNIPKRLQRLQDLITEDFIEACEKDLQSKRSMIALWVNQLPILNQGDK